MMLIRRCYTSRLRGAQTTDHSGTRCLLPYSCISARSTIHLSTTAGGAGHHSSNYSYKTILIIPVCKYSYPFWSNWTHHRTSMNIINDYNYTSIYHRRALWYSHSIIIPWLGIFLFQYEFRTRREGFEEARGGLAVYLRLDVPASDWRRLGRGAAFGSVAER